MVNWKVLAVTHPGYASFMTYDDVRESLRFFERLKKKKFTMINFSDPLKIFLEAICSASLALDLVSGLLATSPIKEKFYKRSLKINH